MCGRYRATDDADVASSSLEIRALDDEQLLVIDQPHCSEGGDARGVVKRKRDGAARDHRARKRIEFLKFICSSRDYGPHSACTSKWCECEGG